MVVQRCSTGSTDHFLLRDAVLEIIEDLWVFRDFLGRFGASNCPKLRKGFWSKRDFRSSKNPPKFVEPLGIYFLLKSRKSASCEIKSPTRLETWIYWNSNFLKISGWGNVGRSVISAGRICRFGTKTIQTRNHHLPRQNDRKSMH